MPILYSYEPSSSDSNDILDTSSDDSDRLADTSWLVRIDSLTEC